MSAALPLLDPLPGVRPGHRDALVALLQLRLGHAFKPGIDPSTGAKVAPVRQLIISMGLLGLLFSTNASRVEMQLFLDLLFLSAASLMALCVLPDTPEVREMHSEVLGSRPISPARATLSLAIGVAAGAGFVVSCFAVPSLAVAAAFHGLAYGRALLLWIALLLFSAALSLLWVRTLLVLMRYVSTAALRKAAQYALVLAITACAGLSAGVLGSSLTLPSWVGVVVPLFPTSFVSRIGASGGFEVLDGASLLALSVGAVLLSRLPDMRGERWLDATTAAHAATAPLGARAARALASWRMLDRRIAAASAAVSEAILTAWAREEMGRVRALSTNALAIVFFLGGFIGFGAMSAAALGYVGFSVVIDGVQMTRQSSHAAAGWLFRAAPLRGTAVVDGVFRAIAIKLLALPCVLYGVLAVRDAGLPGGLALTLAWLAALRLTSFVALGLRPAYPLGAEIRAMPPLMGFVVSFGLAMAGALLYGVVFALTTYFGALGVALALGISATLWALSFLARAWAGGRLERAVAVV